MFRTFTCPSSGVLENEIAQSGEFALEEVMGLT